METTQNFMGRGAGEAAPKIGEGAKTFYDTQAFQYGVRDKWGYSFYHPNEDGGHKIFPKKPETAFFIKPWEQVTTHMNLMLGILSFHT